MLSFQNAFILENAKHCFDLLGGGGRFRLVSATNALSVDKTWFIVAASNTNSNIVNMGARPSTSTRTCLIKIVLLQCSLL
jgi:hypothetical protein